MEAAITIQYDSHDECLACPLLLSVAGTPPLMVDALRIKVASRKPILTGSSDSRGCVHKRYRTIRIRQMPSCPSSCPANCLVGGTAIDLAVDELTNLREGFREREVEG